MEGNGIDRVHNIPASLALPVAFEGVLLCLSLFTVIEVFHGDPALDGTKGIACAIGIAAYAPCLILQRRVSDLFWLPTLDAADTTTDLSC